MVDSPALCRRMSLNKKRLLKKVGYPVWVCDCSSQALNTTVELRRGVNGDTHPGYVYPWLMMQLLLLFVQVLHEGRL